MDIHFGCTACGACCNNLKLPLTVAEAMTWLGRGQQVQLICEAAPSPGAGEESPAAAHFRRRSFTSVSGTMPVQVAVILAASFEGSCPNLQADRRCAIYADRPLVCRIYPAEINPFIELRPGDKACPPQAWSADAPLLQRSGRILDAILRDDIQASREAGALDAGVKQRACTALQVCDTARAGEGFVIHSPAVEALSTALARAIANEAGDAAVVPGWRFVSDRPDSIRALADGGGIAVHSGTAGAPAHPPGNVRGQQFVGFGTAPAALRDAPN